jgi:hypothetical protein
MYEVLFLCRRGLGLTRGIGEKSNGSGPADEIYNGCGAPECFVIGLNHSL